MADQDVSLCSIALAIVLISVSIFTSLSFNLWNILRKTEIQLPTWVAGRNHNKAHHLDELVNIPTASSRFRESIFEPKWSPSWWTEEKVFQLERRAIFSKEWLFATHISRFQKPGDYRTFEIVGFSFIVILSKDRQLRTFHNVCRHRAYAVTKKEYGSSTVLGCRYHGWSYDTKGKLIKAPEFENVKGFEKAANGLWEVKTAVKEGLVFVNFDAGNEIHNIELTDSDRSMKRWKIQDMKPITDWSVEGAFNWKIGAGEAFDDDSTKEVSPWLSTFLSRWRTREEDVRITKTTRIRRLNSGKVLIARLLPKAANATTVEYTVYARNADKTKAAEDELNLLKKSAQLEISQLESRQQSLQKGGFTEPRKMHNELRAMMKDHAKAEREVCREIHPAARKQNFTQEGMDDDDLCRELEKTDDLNGENSFCSTNAKGLLDW